MQLTITTNFNNSQILVTMGGGNFSFLNGGLVSTQLCRNNINILPHNFAWQSLTAESGKSLAPSGIYLDSPGVAAGTSLVYEYQVMTTQGAQVDTCGNSGIMCMVAQEIYAV